MNAPLTVPLELPAAAPKGDEVLYEVIDGQRKGLPPMGAYETSLASILVQVLGLFARGQKLGRVVGEMLFNLPGSSRQRRPDVAFVSYQRWPRAQPVPRDVNAWDVAPELVVEVVSPTDEMMEVLTKVREYFQAGALLVWLVLPSERLIYVYRSRTQIEVLTDADRLDGGAVLPGFQMPVAGLFDDEAP